MAKYEVLRDCYTSDRYFARGKVVELSSEIVKNPKNFKLADAPQVSSVQVPPVAKEESIPSTGEVQSVSPVKEYKCSVCGKVVSTALALSGHSRSHKRR